MLDLSLTAKVAKLAMPIVRRVVRYRQAERTLIYDAVFIYRLYFDNDRRTTYTAIASSAQKIKKTTR